MIAYVSMLHDNHYQYSLAHNQPMIAQLVPHLIE